MKVCSSCGRENAADASFCSGCGTSLEVPAPAREERKVVSVLFCDLVGSTARAEKLDPEDVRAVLSRYHEHVRHNLERYGGTVEKFIGDAVMALFGAPVAHEDDPERAVRAALAIREWAEQEGELQVRIGVTTGEALVSLGARPSHGEGMAAGDVVNTAARLQAAAPENGILVDETTYRATARVIDHRERSPVAAKGKEQPVPVWEPHQARSRVGVDVRQQARAPLVGRDHELDVLQDAFRRSQRDRSPQLVTLAGVPGIGKSRLVWELFASLDGQPALINWRQGRSLPYGDGVTYWALGEMVKSQAGLLDTDDDVTGRRKLREMVAELVSDPADAAWIESHLRPLVGLVGDETVSDGAARERFAAWRRFLEALADDRPLILVFEDLHWADDQLLDFVDHLVEWATDVPLLVVVTARPELLARRPEWGGGKPNSTTLSLAPLSDDETRRLVHRLLDRSVLAADVQSRLVDRAGGNPLYAEEFIRMLGERGLDDVAGLPETVQGVIAARLDGLSEEEKSVLQAASVVGKVFWLGAVVAVAESSRGETEQTLHLLVRKEFVRRERRSSVGGESEYAFGHVLVRDVAYGQIPRATRADMHHRAAQWVESLGRPEDHAELLAHHYGTALEFARLAGQETPVLVEETREALFEAADRALGLNAFSSAALFYERALHLAGDRLVEPHRLLRAGRAIRWARDGGDEILARAKDALVAAGDLGGAAEAEVLRADLRFSVDGDFPRTRQHIAEAHALVADLGQSRGKALVISQVARFNMLGFENEAALEHIREALDLIDQLRLDDLRAGALNTRGVVRTRLGDPEGIADLERAVELATRTNAVTEIGRAHNNLADCFAQLGDFRRAREVLEHGIAVMEEVPEQRAWAHWLRGTRIVYRFESGEWDEAMPEVAQYVRDAQSGVGGGVTNLVLTMRAGILGARGQLAAALADCDQLAALADSTGDPEDRAGALAAVSYAQLAAGNRAEARSAAEAFFETIGAIPDAPVAFYAVAFYELGFDADVVAALESRRSAYDRTARRLCTGDFEAAADEFAKIGVARMEAEARLLAARDLVAKGRRAEADMQLERALAFFRSVRATPYVEAAESLLAATA